MASVSLDDLELALIWVSGSGPMGNAAYVSKAAGKVFYASDSLDVEEELPDDVDDPDRYWSVPHRNEFGLAGNLLPARCVRAVQRPAGA